MKKLLLRLIGMLLIVLTFQTCQKDDQVKQNNVGQLTYNLGCELLSQAEYDALPKAELPEMMKVLPATWTITSPPVGNQGTEGSCVAWGTAYAARSIDWYMHNQQTSYSENTNIFSPEYVYNHVKVGSCGSGAYVSVAMNFLKNTGVCTWSWLPYSDNNGCSIGANANWDNDALIHKISGWGTVPLNVNTLKNLLAMNNPVIVAGPVDNNFVNLANNGVLTNRSGSLGGHCYCLVGYDNSKNAFKFINSWGTSWATQGYGYINYNYIKKWWSEVYKITPTL